MIGQFKGMWLITFLNNKIKIKISFFFSNYEIEFKDQIDCVFMN